MRLIRVAVVAALMGLAPASASLAHDAPGDVAYAAVYDSAMQAAQEGDAELVVGALEPVLDPAAFGELSSGRQYEVAKLYALAAKGFGDAPKAHRGFVLVTGNPRADAMDWHERLRTAIWIGDAPDAYAAFLRLQKSGELTLSLLADVDVDILDQLLRQLPDARAHAALGAQMEREGWQPLYASYDPSRLWLRYAEALLGSGDGKGAARAAGRVVNPMLIMIMHADRRFDSVIAADPSLQDPEAAAEQYLAAAKAYMAANPRSLSGPIGVARALAVLNREGEALPLLEDAAHALAMAPRNRPAFDDPELLDQLEAWRTSALISLGRKDEAIGARMARAACHCVPWAALNVARALLEADRPQEALRWVRDAPMIDDPEVRMETAQVTACAATAAKDEVAANRALAYLREHGRASPEALAEALMCADHLDEAAKVLAGQVADPRTRLAALGVLQSHLVSPDARGYRGKMRTNWAAVTRVPALRAEIDKVGRLNRFELAQFDRIS